MMRHQTSYRWLILLLLLTLSCRGEEEGLEPETNEEERSESEEGEERSMAEKREVFGLPLPPEYLSIQREELHARVATKMNLDELEAFFATRLQDYEVLRVGVRLQVLPLRPYSPSIDAYHFGGRRSHVVVNYRLPLDQTSREREEKEQQEFQALVERARAEKGNPPRRRNQGERPEWLDDLQGQPVELRTEDGQLLAPGARWGVPYTPPKGSPLHTPRNIHNFGRPFGDWRPH